MTWAYGVQLTRVSSSASERLVHLSPSQNNQDSQRLPYTPGNAPPMERDPLGPGDSPPVSEMLSFQSPGTLASASPTNAVTGTSVVRRNSGTRRPARQGA